MSQPPHAVPHIQQPTLNRTVVVASPILEVATLLAQQWRAGAFVGFDHMSASSGWPIPAVYRRRGFNRWCSGGDRIILFHDSGWCLKAPLNVGHESANRKELAILAAVAPEDRLLFAETHSLPGDILLQREYRVDPGRFVQFTAESPELLRAGWRLRLADIHQHNVGWRPSGSWVFIDWAGVCRPQRIWAGASGPIWDQ